MFKTTRGLVLREVRYKEADRILTVLTEDMGKMTVKARGALRKGSKIAVLEFVDGFAKILYWRSYGYIDASLLTDLVPVSRLRSFLCFPSLQCSSATASGR